MQSMEYAPRDGTVIRVLVRHAGVVCWWNVYYDNGWFWNDCEPAWKMRVRGEFLEWKQVEGHDEPTF